MEPQKRNVRSKPSMKKQMREEIARKEDLLVPLAVIILLLAIAILCLLIIMMVNGHHISDEVNSFVVLKDEAIAEFKHLESYFERMKTEAIEEVERFELYFESVFKTKFPARTKKVI